MKLRCAAANAAWIASSLPAARAFRANLGRVADVQREILLRLTGFRSVAEYQERVPVRTYDEIAPELRELPGVEHWEPTSGSSGATKRIPYTRALREELGRAIAPWIVDLARREPRAFAGESYWSLSPLALRAADDAPSSDPRAHGGDEQALGPFRAALIRATQAVPPSVVLAEDLETFRRETVRHLVACRSLSLISVWHPSFLTLLVSGLGDLDRIWPNLRVISCWTDASSAAGAAELARLFPQARIEPKGLLSTEGVTSIPIDGMKLLAYRSHFCELRDIGSGHVVLATEGEPGRRYSVILTTGGGLRRYDTEDVVEIEGFREACPIVRFVARAAHVSDHFGEKLHEIFVRERLEHALRLHGVNASFAMLACEGNRYVLFIETDEPLDAVTETLERSLRENFHYDHCRRLGQLAPLEARRIEDGAATYLAYAAANGQRLGDVKPPALDRRTGWEARFRPAAHHELASELVRA